MEDDAHGQSGPKGIQSVESAFQLIEPFLHAPGPFTMTVLAQAAGMAPSKASFYLTSLVRAGVLARTRRAYSLGPTALQWGLSALAQVDVVEAAQDSIHKLRDDLGFPLFLSIWSNSGPIIVQHLHGTRSSSWTMQIGAVLPILSATGRALLAHAEPSLQRSVVDKALREANPDEPWFGQSRDQILELLQTIRRTGISPRSGAVIPGFGSIATAILAHDGTAAAAITLISDLHASEALDRCAKALLAAAESVSRMIGGQPDRRGVDEQAVSTGVAQTG